MNLKEFFNAYFLQTFFIAIYPVSNLFSHNAQEAYFVDYLIFIFFYFIICFSLFLLFNRIFNSKIKASLLLSMLISFFYLIPVVRDILPNNIISRLAQISLYGIRLIRVSYIFIIFFPILILLIKFLFSLNKRVLNFLASFLFLPFLALNVFFLCKIFLIKRNVRTLIKEYNIQNVRFRDKNQKLFIKTKSKDLPDIYFIILDAYASNEVWKRFYNYDNSGFTNELRNRGFIVNDYALSNYCKTQYSLAATLSMNYHTKNNDGLFVYKILNNNVLYFLNLSDYKYFHVKSSSQFNTRIPFFSGSVLGWIKDRFFLPYGFISSFIRIRTAIANFWDFLIKKNHYNEIREQFYNLNSIVGVYKRKFVFAHFLCPHPPVVFDSDGSFCVAGDYEYGIVNQSRYINKRILETIDLILETSINSPIIILQGDHGFFWAKKKKNAYGILNALYLPALNKNDFIDNITPVNNFRFIFNKYFGTNFEILENKQL